MATPTTTGTTSTSAAVAMLKWGRIGTMAAPSPTDTAIPTTEPTSHLRTAPLSTHPVVRAHRIQPVQYLFRPLAVC
jgi:hypothetical protein